MQPLARAPDVESDRREHSLIDAALKLTLQTDHGGVCRTLLDVVESLFDAPASWILLHDRRTNHLVTAALRGPGADAYADVRIPADRGIAGLAFSAAEPVFVPEVSEETRWFDGAAMQRSGLPSVLTLPLLYGEQRIGVVGFHSPRFGPESLPSAADRQLAQGVAALATLALTNARLFKDLDAERQARTRVTQQRRALSHEVNHLRSEVRQSGIFGAVIGNSAPLREVLEFAAIVAPTDTTVLLLGETGTGKELIARSIHDGGRRARNIFVAVNCAAMPPALLESELFGHEKGAFTGAIDRKIGKFELAEGGSLFLDEIGELPSDAQAKLLRVLQEREVTRIGGTKAIRVGTRVIAATNQDLLARVHSGLFRSDLYYRLSVFPIVMPPLRERRDDIAALVTHFAERYACRLHRPVPVIEPAAMERLTAYDWPGNIRELQNVIERAVILARNGRIDERLITAGVTPVAGGSHAPGISAASPESTAPSLIAFAEAERAAIVRAVSASGWRISGRGGAAQILGLKPTTLHAKMKKLGIRRPCTTRLSP
jgi:formate hydrogenlyase transcriptional activator